MTPLPTRLLKELAEINPRATHSAADELVSFVGMADLDEIAARTSAGTPRRFSEVAKGYTPFQNGDLLAAKITPCWQNGKVGEAALELEHGMGSTEFHVIRPGSEVDRRYLLHFLRTPVVRDTGTLRMTGSGGQRRVPAKYISDLAVPAPPVAEQRRIASILDQADAIRTKRRAQLTHLDGLPGALFHEMFDNPRTSKAWKIVPFLRIARLSAGRNLVNKDSNSHPTFRVLRISAVTTGHFLPSESKPLPAGYVPPASHIVRRGDLLMSRANTSELVGASALVDREPEGAVLPDKIWRLDWQIAQPVPLFWLATLQAPSMRRRISALSSGSGGSMKNIPKSKLESLPLTVPPTALQNLFADKVTAIRAERDRVAKTLEADEELFAALQYQAFRGEL